MDASELISRMADAYASCATYRDEGVVSAIMIDGPHAFQRRTTRRPFRTLFVRPSKWRFEFWEETIGPREEWQHLIIWTDAKGHHAWWTVKSEESGSGEISRLLAGATGVSGSSAHTVPVMLDSTVRGRSIVNTREAEWIGDDEQIDGHWCARIRVARGLEGSQDLWIDRNSYMLRKIFERKEFNASVNARINDSIRRHNEQRVAEGKPPLPESEPHRDFIAESTTHYRSQVNVVIEDSEFEFTPPVP